jgi:hypothetical protein
MAQAFASDTRAYPQTAVMSEWLTNGIVGTDAIRAIASVNVSLALVRLLFLVPLAIGKPGRINRKTDGLHVASDPPLRPRNLWSALFCFRHWESGGHRRFVEIGLYLGSKVDLKAGFIIIQFL